MIKLFAIFAMVIDHIGVFFFPDILIFRILGRLSFPLFAWGISKGYSRTNNFNIYCIRLLILAAVSQLPYSLLFSDGTINVCFTLLAGLFLLKLYDSKVTLWVKIPGILFIFFVAEFLHFEYGLYGISTIFIFYIMKHREASVYYFGGLTLVFTLLYHYHPIQLVAAFSPLLAITLEQYDFKLNKILNYSFYPAHLFIIFFVQGGLSL